jgi:hypothetical protein
VYYFFCTRKWKRIASDNIYEMVIFTGVHGLVTLVRSGVFDTLCPLCLSHVSPTFEHRAAVERFVSIQFLKPLKPKTIGRTPWTGDQPVAIPLPTQTQNNANIYAFSGIRTHDPSA